MVGFNFAIAHEGWVGAVTDGDSCANDRDDYDERQPSDAGGSDKEDVVMEQSEQSDYMYVESSGAVGSDYRGYSVLDPAVVSNPPPTSVGGIPGSDYDTRVTCMFLRETSADERHLTRSWFEFHGYVRGILS